ncbi:aKG-HExxH-type peptide beta-hydroxylase [Streptomyces sp. NPDC002643]
MISSALSEEALRELGRTGGGPKTLALLVRDQHTRRLFLLRAVLDAVEAADTRLCPPSLRERLKEDWALLDEADIVGGEKRNGISPARDLLLYPLVGPWARSCLRALRGREVTRSEEERRHTLHRDLAHFSALAASAAIRAGLPFAGRLTARDGVLFLPSLGALRTAVPGETAIEVVCGSGRVILRQPGEIDTVVHLEAGAGGVTRSDDAAWKPQYALPGLLPGSPPVPLDDLDPYRGVSGPRHQDLSGPASLDEAAWRRWLDSWSGVLAMLRLGGGQRGEEAAVLLRCLVPLVEPTGAHGDGGGTVTGTGSCSGTRREAFGAVLSSAPPSPATFAATLVHEIQHAKLGALGEMVTLHGEGLRERYFAPWRPDPRPYDGLLQGVYSHVALADFFHRCALADEVSPAQREAAWREHARYRAQVAETLPVIESGDLTAAGRAVVEGLSEQCERMNGDPSPHRIRIHAEEGVRAARMRWMSVYGDR